MGVFDRLFRGSAISLPNKGKAPMRTLFIMDQLQAKAMQPGLERDGIAVESIDQLDRADFKLMVRSFEAVVLDQRLLKEETTATLRRWRQEGVKTHTLLVLPCESSGSDRAACLDAGADACLMHPLNWEELCAYLRALRRRDEMLAAPTRRIHDLEINTDIRTVRRGGKCIQLTPREFDLLHLLASHPGKVMTHSMILQRLYDEQIKYSNIVTVYVSYLRNKVDKGFQKPLILTRWGQGYFLRPEGS
jgi:two-component system OmpR family response regulator